MQGLQEYRSRTQGVLIVAIAIGIALISGSFWFPEHSLFREIVKELGIVLVSVFGVSILYEMFVAEKHFLKFNQLLAKLIERSTTNAAICERLGILQIFPTKQEYLEQFKFYDLCSHIKKGGRLRIIGSALFNVLRQDKALKIALESGAKVELALLDPNTPDEIFQLLKPHVQRGELNASLDRFHDLAEDIKASNFEGTLELRYHRIPLFEAFAEFQTSSDSINVWEVSFAVGGDNKRDFLLDPEKPFSKDMQERYDRIWQSGRIAFRYP